MAELEIIEPDYKAAFWQLVRYTGIAWANARNGHHEDVMTYLDKAMELADRLTESPQFQIVNKPPPFPSNDVRYITEG